MFHAMPFEISYECATVTLFWFRLPSFSTNLVRLQALYSVSRDKNQLNIGVTIFRHRNLVNIKRNASHASKMKTCKNGTIVFQIGSNDSKCWFVNRSCINNFRHFFSELQSVNVFCSHSISIHSIVYGVIKNLNRLALKCERYEIGRWN